MISRFPEWSISDRIFINTFIGEVWRYKCPCVEFDDDTTPVQSARALHITETYLQGKQDKCVMRENISEKMILVDG